ncbi:MAG: polysaccharide biosynthesis tyrosine autokinase [bacterium]
MIEEEIDLRNILSIASKRKWLIVISFLIATAAAVIYLQFKTPVYRATTTLLIEKELSKSSVREVIGIETRDKDYYQTQYAIIKSRNLAEEVIKTLNIAGAENPKNYVSGLIGAITVKPVGSTRLVDISVDDPNPGKAEVIANTLAEKYIEENQKSRLFFSHKILIQFSEDEKNKILDGKYDIETLPSIMNNSLIQRLKGNLIEMQVQLARISTKYKENYPEVHGLKKAIQMLEEKISQETDKILFNIKAELMGKMTVNNIRVIDRAEIPKTPISPNKKKVILAAMFLGLAAGAGLAFFLEFLDYTVKTKDDVEKHLGIPFLGYIPKVKPEKNEPFKLTGSTLSQNPSHFSESLRNIRVSITFSGEISTLLITSTVPGEGKTTFAVGLAFIFACTGNEVLLIDTDLRKPKIQQTFNIESTHGLSSYLSGQTTIDKIIHKTSTPNLSVIPAGAIPPNPSELLGQERFLELVEKLKKKFRWIIFDSPPIFPVSDAVIISKITDGAVYVANFGKVKKEGAYEGKEKLVKAGARIIGAVINNIDTEKHKYYYPYYSYYHYYGESKKQNKKPNSTEGDRS